MPLIQWQEKFNTGIDIIDQQHKLLVEYINVLFDSYTQGAGNQQLEALINKLNTYASFHFAREENYFELSNYPDIDSHIDEHEKFEEVLDNFEQDFKRGTQDISPDILTFLSNWLINHINKRDKAYVDHLLQSGVIK